MDNVLNRVLSTGRGQRIPWTTDDIELCVQRATVSIFSKGTEENPRCGICAKAMDAVRCSGLPFEVIDISADRSILPALSAYAGKPNVPAVFVSGKLVSDLNQLPQVLEELVARRANA